MTPAPSPPSTDAIASGLTTALTRTGRPAPQGLERLSGGANMESWRFVAGDELFVLRRAPGGVSQVGGRSMNLADEAKLIRAAHAAGVLAPEVVLVLEPGDGLGAGFVMRALPGTADPATILAEADPDALLSAIAREMAATHRIDTASLSLPRLENGPALSELRQRFLGYGGDRPILALALRWLSENLPPAVPPRLVHGDFRLGNLLVQQGRLTGVLDWELAHLGDPHEDLAYGCMTVWRFSRPDRPAFGLGPVAALTSAYEQAGGEKFDPVRFRFWLTYRMAWWALGCLQMANTWRSGADRSLERVVVGRRLCEQELDLLLLLEDQAPATERTRPLPPSPPPREPGSGEPTGAEVLTAVSEWLASDIKPLLAGRGRFDLAVARNALGIAAREMTLRPAEADAALAADLLSGRTDLTTPGLLARLRRMALDKANTDMPKYPALAMARAQWEGS
ncbi:MAG: phosphotransferase family protein [Proteobacteria bacterium]|nr:phosphotransferase family protein [Pseudomonadota bacterium]